MSTILRNVVWRAYALAKERQHELVTLEHLLAALMEQPEIGDLIRGLDRDPDKIHQQVLGYLDEPDFHSITSGDSTKSPRHTGLLLTVIKKAKAQSLFSNKPELGSVDLLLAMFNIEESHASFCLLSNGIQKQDLLDLLKNDHGDDVSQQSATELLQQYCVNLNERAKQRKIDPVIGREDEINLISQTLARRTKNNVLLLGDPGVGKTVIVEGLAKAIVEGKVPDVLAKTTIWSLDIGSLVAGTKFRGDFEERIKHVIAAFQSLPDAVMFIDEIHMIMGAGVSGGGAMDAANLFKPALGRGELRCIGSTTDEEYRKHFEKDRAIMRRFQKIHVAEPSIDNSKRILAALSPYYEQYHGVVYEAEALDAAVDLSVRYLHGFHLPDKAIDIVDAAGAKQRILPDAHRKSSIGIQEITAEVSRIARVPLSSIFDNSSPSGEDLSDLDVSLSRVIFGQPNAVQQLTDAVLIGRSGLRESTRTQGAFLFTGPTGVGKTEIAKQLASLLGISFVRFDMSEFQEKHTISKLIGSPPGYVGYHDGGAGNGILINALEKNPHCLLLFDEIEKAHPDIVNVLLQVMDNGKVSSQGGKEASAAHAFIILTSNLGASDMEKHGIGFGAGYRTDAGEDAIKRWFTPEFRNRLDAIIPFNRLDQQNMLLILDKFIAQLNVLSQSKNVRIIFDQSAKDWLINKGFDPLMGARPLARVMHEHVKKPLSREMLFGKLKNGGSVIFQAKIDGLVHEIMQNPVPAENTNMNQEQLEEFNT
jgi:ATP-dependent Clp protease ATP-binding subunit ClpA